jgi:hypothetical protein
MNPTSQPALTPHSTPKPNVPAEIFLGHKDYSILTDLKVNGWLLLATILSAFSDIMFPETVAQWPLTWRIVLTVAPFAAILLWARHLMRWIRGMDEMHQRITLASVLFAVSATFFSIMLWHGLERAGFFASLSPGRGHWDIATVGHAFLLLTLFYFTGHTVIDRRYR